MAAQIHSRPRRVGVVTTLLFALVWIAPLSVGAATQGDNLFVGNPNLSPGEQKGVFVYLEDGAWNVVFSGGPRTSEDERDNGNARFIGSIAATAAMAAAPEILEGFGNSRDYVRLEDQGTLIAFRSIATADGFDHFRFSGAPGEEPALFLTRTVNIPLDPVPVFLGRSRTRAGTLPLVLEATGDDRRPRKTAFPRLGNVQIGRTPRGYTDSGYLDQLARYDLILLGKTYALGGRTAGAIKQRNPDAFVGQYTNFAAVPVNRKSTYHTALRDKLSSERGPRPTGTAPDWWLREKVVMVDGELVGDSNGDGIGDIVLTAPGNGRANITDWVEPDADGNRWPEWKVADDYVNGMDDPDFDVWYFDATNFNVRSKGFDRGVAGMDFSGGRAQDRDEVNQAWREGYRSAWRRLEELRPDIYIIGNHDWYRYADPESGALPPGNGFLRRIDGGLLEDVMRPDSGPEIKFGWRRIYDWYRWSLTYFRSRDLTFFSVAGDLTHAAAADGSAQNPTPADFRWFRYTFGTCLLQDGYYVYGAEDFPSGSSLWFDEYDRAGRDDTSWMGVGIDGPGNPGGAGPDTAWQSGVYRRDFEHAVVLVNPRGNGPQTVVIKGGLRRLRGGQAPDVNNGKLVGEVTLQDGDGIVLVRTDYAG